MNFYRVGRNRKDIFTEEAVASLRELRVICREIAEKTGRDCSRIIFAVEDGKIKLSEEYKVKYDIEKADRKVNVYTSLDKSTYKTIWHRGRTIFTDTQAELEAMIQADNIAKQKRHEKVVLRDSIIEKIKNMEMEELKEVAELLKDY